LYLVAASKGDDQRLLLFLLLLFGLCGGRGGRGRGVSMRVMHRLSL
jgi:hypothetical protein